MAAPFLWLARTVGQGAKARGFLRKLYSGKAGIGERIQRSGMKRTVQVGKSGTTRPLFTPKKDIWSKSKVKIGEGLSGVKEKLRPAGRHLKKHRRAYGWGVTGAAAWDILDSD